MKADVPVYLFTGFLESGKTKFIRETLEDERFNNVVFEEYDEQYMYFFAAALLFFVLEMLIGERRAKKRLFE